MKKKKKRKKKGVEKKKGRGEKDRETIENLLAPAAD